MNAEEQNILTEAGLIELHTNRMVFDIGNDMFADIHKDGKLVVYRLSGYVPYVELCVSIEHKYHVVDITEIIDFMKRFHSDIESREKINIFKQFAAKFKPKSVT